MALAVLLGTPPRASSASARVQRPDPRPRSLGLAPLTPGERAELSRDLAGLRRVYRRRPRTWGECARRQGPCGFVSCKYNLFLDVDALAGAIKVNFPGREIDELPETCALRVAAAGELSQERVGQLTNVTEEWVRQIEIEALVKVRRRLRGSPLRQTNQPASRKSRSRELGPSTNDERLNT